MPDKPYKSLYKYLPEDSVLWVWDLIVKHKVSFTITPERFSKLGDYRPPFKNKGHRISINGNLNKYAFLLTTLHEIAHLLTWNKHKNRVTPHGFEWKIAFKQIIQPILDKKIFPNDITLAIQMYMTNPAATNCSNSKLSRVLAKYDTNKKLFLEDIPHGATFQLSNGLTLVKGNKLRKNYTCSEKNGIKKYRVNPLAEVKIMS